MRRRIHVRIPARLAAGAGLAVLAVLVALSGGCGAGAQPGLDSCLDTCEARSGCNPTLDVEACRDSCEQMPRRCARSRDLADDLDDCTVEECLEIGACELAVRMAHLCTGSD